LLDGSPMSSPARILAKFIITRAEGLFERSKCFSSMMQAAFALSEPSFVRVPVSFCCAAPSNWNFVARFAMSLWFGGMPTKFPCCICLMTTISAEAGVEALSKKACTVSMSPTQVFARARRRSSSSFAKVSSIWKRSQSSLTPGKNK